MCVSHNSYPGPTIWWRIEIVGEVTEVIEDIEGDISEKEMKDGSITSVSKLSVAINTTTRYVIADCRAVIEELGETISESHITRIASYGTHDSFTAENFNFVSELSIDQETTNINPKNDKENFVAVRDTFKKIVETVYVEKLGLEVVNSREEFRRSDKEHHSTVIHLSNIEENSSNGNDRKVFVVQSSSESLSLCFLMSVMLTCLLAFLIS